MEISSPVAQWSALRSMTREDLRTVPIKIGPFFGEIPLIEPLHSSCFKIDFNLRFNYFFRRDAHATNYA